MLTHEWREPRAPSRVVVLGSTGFVGRELMAHLAEARIPALGLGSRDVDLLDPGAAGRLSGIIRKDDALVVISALTPDKGRDTATMMKNLTMAQHLAEALAQAPCGHLLYLSSDAVYEDDANPVRETSPRHPSNLYGLMHVVRERVLAEATRAASIPYVILRPSLLFGAGDTHNSYGPNRFLKSALASRKITVSGRGEEKRDHVYVGDVCRLVVEALKHRSVGVLNIATGTSRSFLEVADAIVRLLPDVEIEMLPRTAPITHRHFDIVETVRAFAAFRFMAFDEAIRQTMQTSAPVG